VNQFIIYGIGFFAQTLFGSRMIIQWIQSEKMGHVVSPSLFWKTSLIASAIFLIYGLLRHDAIIVLGQVLIYFIYIRNLQLKSEWKKMSFFFRFCFLILPLCILIMLMSSGVLIPAKLFSSDQLYSPALLVGGVGQLLLNVRFVYQWFLSEKEGYSFMPLGFWILSALGSILVIIYAVFRYDPVLFLAQILGIVIYTRNITLYLRSPENSKCHGA
jgi:lipid-A-disaccharide synthase-like uncharacterized protein